MTGFGRAEGPVNDRKVTVELRSLNSKQLDLQVKVPGVWREKEAELRQWSSERVVRGKADLYVGLEGGQGEKHTVINTELVRTYYRELETLAAGLAPKAGTDLFAMAMRMPDVLTTAKEEFNPAEWPAVMALVEQAWKAFEEFRVAEGAKLQEELGQRTANIRALLADVDAMDGNRLGRIRDRLVAKLEEWQAKVDQQRLEQELVFHIEKLDVSEEKQRLATHCTYFLETMDQEEGQGRKLAFISQEMGREINTLGSKSNDAEMQKRVVLMKDELEKIKEQVLNVL